MRHGQEALILSPSQNLNDISSRARVVFTDLPDLASEKVGGKTLMANDEFFAPKENLLKPGRAIFIPEKFTENGKWMDGWETRRRRSSGYDWCIIQLGLPGVIQGINVDTDYFIGNFPEYCSIEACELDPNTSTDALIKALWREILPKSALRGGTQNLFPILSSSRWSHLRLNIFPDGGVARLRVHGQVKPNWESIRRAKSPIDLAALENGAIVVACIDSFFGSKDNLIMPGRAVTMGDGWETRRKRVPGHDWIVVQLGIPGYLSKIEVDTNHFKGNFPESCSLEGCYFQNRPVLPVDFTYPSSELVWKEILGRTRLQAHFQHIYESEIQSQGPFTHVRLNIFPDGGISRLRIYGSLLERNE